MRKIPSQARSKATIDTILSASTRVLLKRGYDKSSTNIIAEIAGVSVGSLYEYFPGKEAVFAEVRRREDRRLFELIMEHPEPASIKELLKLHVAVYLEFVRSNLALHVALISDVPQFAVTEQELPLYKNYIPWATKFLLTHREELRSFSDLSQVTEFVNRVSRATIDNYVLYAPEQLNDAQIEEYLIELLERFLLKREAVS